MLMQQDRNQRRLQNDDRTDESDLPPVLFPQRRLAEIDRASGRKLALGYLPALHFAPIEFWGRESGRRSLDIAGLFTREDTKGDRGRCQTALAYRVHWSADEFVPEEAVIIRKDWRSGHRRQPAQPGVCLMGNARRVDIHQMPEDGAVRRKACRVPENGFKRPLIVPFELDPAIERSKLPPQFPEPECFVRRSSVDDCNGSGVGQNAQDVLENGGESTFYRPQGAILCHRCCFGRKRRQPG